MNLAPKTVTIACALSAAATLYRGVRGTLAVHASLRWLGQEQSQCDETRGDVRFLLILPMLREQRVISDTTVAFCALARTSPGSRVVLVTTEREHAERARAEHRLPELARALANGTPASALLDRFAGLLPGDRLVRLADAAGGRAYEDCLAAAREVFDEVPTTPIMASTLAAGEPLLSHHHYPHATGAMADQINYAVAAELEQALDAESTYIAIHNADSRPDPCTLRGATDTVARLSCGPGGAPRVMQQSALFLENVDAFAGGLRGLYLRGAAFLQTRWSLAHEIPVWRRQSRSARRGLAARLAHCTGHGLFIRADEFQRLGGLPTETMNEDLAFGYLLSAARVPIDPIPVLESADSPDTIKQVLRQKRQWFWSYADYPRIVRIAARRDRDDQGKRPIALAWPVVGHADPVTSHNPVRRTRVTLPA